MERFKYYINKHVIGDIIEFRNPYKPVRCPICKSHMASFRFSCPEKLTFTGKIVRRLKGWDPRIGDMGRMKQRVLCEIHLCRGDNQVPDSPSGGCGYKMIYTLVDDCGPCFRKLQCLTFNKIVRF